MICPNEWFCFMEWRGSHPEEYRGAASMRAFRNGLPDERRAVVRAFLVAASSATNDELHHLDCPEAHNGFYLVADEGVMLRDQFKADLAEFDAAASTLEGS